MASGLPHPLCATDFENFSERFSKEIDHLRHLGFCSTFHKKKLKVPASSSKRAQSARKGELPQKFSDSVIISEYFIWGSPLIKVLGAFNLLSIVFFKRRSKQERN
jgi:hypothetical protein